MLYASHSIADDLTDREPKEFEAQIENLQTFQTCLTESRA
jgi:hypothetical protein